MSINSALMMVFCWEFFDYLGGEGVNRKFDKRTLKRLQDLELLEKDKKKTLPDLIDTYIRYSKARQAYTV